jgi:chemotaxis protein methyltransferase CheR
MKQPGSMTPSAFSPRVPMPDYIEFKNFLEKACGILLGDNKQYLVTSRLNKLMAEYNINSLQDLVEQMQQFSNRKLKEAVVDAMTTNETLWFRDSHPFETLKKQLLPELQKNNSGKIRLWSAACSSGQEPYSLSMIAQECREATMGALRTPVEILATELSPSMLEYAKRAEYNDLALRRGLSNERLKRFFDPTSNDLWQVKANIRQGVRFQPLNLMDNFLTLGKFDVVFCRNVLIYFSAELKADILQRIHGTLRPGGYLVLGASEGLTDVGRYYEMVQCNPGIIYRAI